MKTGSNGSILLVLFFFSNYCLAQSQAPRFIQITGTSKISLGKITGMTRDKHGIMWLSDQINQCIIRYDGENMTRYMHDAQDSNSLGGGGYPECLFADSAGVIWIGFWGNGLDRFDPVSQKFTHFRYHKNDDEGLSSDSVGTLLIDHLGNLWLGTSRGLDLMDRKTGKIKHYRKTPGDTNSLSSNFVRLIYEDREGTLWVGTGFPWDPDTLDGGLNRMDRKNDRFTRFVNDPQNPHSLVNNKVRSIFEDSRGTFWVGTGGDGLHTMDRKTGLFTRHSYDPSKPEQLSRPPANGSDDHITFINEDYFGNIWIGTLANGINRYDPTSKKITHFGRGTNGPEDFIDNSSWWVNISKDGIFWLSTQENRFYRVDLFTKNLPHVYNVGAVGRFFQEQPTILWISSDSGLIRRDLLTNKTKRFFHDPGKENSLSASNVGTMIAGNNGMYWVGTRGGGINQFNAVSETFTHEHITSKKDSAYYFPETFILYKDDESNLWISTWGHGFNLKNNSTGKTIHYENIPSDTNSLSGNIVVGFSEISANEIWIGTYGGGVNRMNRQTGKFKHFLPGTFITCIYKDDSGILWAGAESGLFKYDKETDQFNSIGRLNSNLQIHSVRTIINDKEGNLWVSCEAGIFKIDPKKKVASLFGLSYGVRGDLISYGSAHRSQDGRLFFGDFNGYYSFFPDQIALNPSSPSIELTDLWLNGIPVKSGVDGPLQKDLQDTKEIILHHDQNTFSLGFSTVYYGNISDNIVYYKLENFDKDWVVTDAGNRAVYQNLPPGSYSFRVKVENTNGKSQEKEVAVKILPPWWIRWWAYILYALGLLIILGLFDRIQRRRILRRERERTKDKELAQAREIEKAYHELKITQTQLIQQEKMASLGELTAGIAHEIQNPLNFVNNFSDVNTELIDEANHAIDTGNSAEAKNLLVGIRDNEEKIKFHGQRADAIVKGMLLHARASSGQKEPTDINALAEEYLRLSYQGLRAKDKSFQASIQTDFDPAIGKLNVIPQDIARVLLNLFNNAFYATAEKKGLRTDHYDPRISVSSKKRYNKARENIL